MIHLNTGAAQSSAHPGSTSARPACGLPARLMRTLPWLLGAWLVACGGGSDNGSTAPPSTVRVGTKQILAAAPASRGGVLINEVNAGNWKGAIDNYGDAEDWVELYNPGTTEVDLTGYGLSNKPASPFNWTFPNGVKVPAKAYLTVWLSKRDRAELGRPLHTNFNLDNGGDAVYLTASNGTSTGILVDSATPPLVQADQSWCRMPSGSASAPFMVCDRPSKDAANTGPSNPALLAKPTLSLGSGFYANAQTLTITGPAGATLRYTTDGSEPTAASSAYAAPLAIAGAQVIRVAAFAAGAAPSLVQTGTYVIDPAQATAYTRLNVVMVALAPDDFAAFQADDQTRDFRASFEMITGGTTSVFKLDAQGSSAGGAGSTDSPLRSMNVVARDAFGVKAFPAALWPDKPGIRTTKKLRLRNGSNDWARAHLRDQLSQRASADGPNLTGASISVAMFVNGQYYGLMDLREREEETLPAQNLGIDKDFVDFLYDPNLPSQEIKNGGDTAAAAYKAMHDYIVGNDMTVAANYTRAKTLMNPDSLAWDWALHMFHANYDWPDHNVHAWRSPEVGNRWTWQTHDMDFAFGIYTSAAYDMSSSFGQPGSELISALMRNGEFRTLYLNTVADQMNLMTPTQLGATLDGLATDMRPYIPAFYAKVGLGPVSNWEAQLTTLRNFFNQREGIYDGHTRAQFGLGPRQPISVAVNDLAMGSVTVNTLDTQKYISAARPNWTGNYYPGVPVTLQANPRPGYAFVGWQGASSATSRRITQTLSTPAPAGFPADNFSVRWTGTLEAQVSGAAQLQTVADDGVRVYFDGQQVIGNWAAQSAAVRTVSVNLVAGRRHNLVVEYFDATGDATMRLNWQLPGAASFSPVPVDRLFALGAPVGTTTGTGLSAQYFANATLSGTPAFLREEAVNVDWGLASPAEVGAPVKLTAVFAPTTAPAAPVIGSVPAQAVRTGDTVALQVPATDPGGYPMTYSATGLPKGPSLNAQTGLIFGRVTTPGVYTSTLKASNGVSTGSVTVVWTVTDRPGTGLLGTSPDSGTPVPNVPPTVSLGAPLANASFVQGTAITLAASAADSDGTVARVEFYDGAGLIGSASAAPFSMSWTGAATGAHSLSARAVDNGGAAGTSATVAISVTAPVNLPPTVALTAPTANASFTVGSVVTVTANAADSDGTVARVDFYDGTTLIASDATAPYAVSYSPSALGVHTLTANAVDNSGATSTSAALAISITAVPPPDNGSGNGLLGQYFATNYLGGPVVLQRTEAINFDWGTAAPGAGVPADNFSVRWVGQVEAPDAGVYQFQTTSDDGVRLWVNGQLVINNWTGHGPTVDTSTAVTLVAGQRTTIVLEYQEYTGGATIQLRWKTPGQLAYVAVPVGRLYANAAPTVSLTAPPANVGVNPGSVVTVSATAIDSDGSVVRVDFYDGSTLIGSSTGPQYSILWTAGAVGQHNLSAMATDNSGATTTSAAVAVTVSAVLPPAGGTGTGLQGQYFNNLLLSGTPKLQRTEAVNFDWGTGSPGAGVPPNFFSARWTGLLQATTGGIYQLQTTSDDGVRVWVNGVQLINNWTPHGPTVDTSAGITLVAGERTSIVVEYQEYSGGAVMRLRWRTPGSAAYVPVPASQLYLP